MEVAGSTSEASRVVATPEGSLVLETYAAPRWAARRDGTGWQQIDTDLRPEGAGVVPNATLADVTFSGGGTAPMASVAVGGGQVALSWSGALPIPRLEGDTAVYESVRPQVDLRVRALSDGFTWSLVVHSAQAAMDPSLETLRFRLDTVGLTKQERSDGGFEILDAAGEPVLGAGNALMWDASGVAATPNARAAVAPEQLREALETAPEQSQQAELPVNLDGDDLVIQPDLDLLRGAQTAYPVVIDPWTTIGKAYWGYAGSTGATRDDGVARVGLDPAGSGTYRSFFRFNLSALSGKTIRSAKFLTELTHSWSCTATPVNLWRSGDLPGAGKRAWPGPGLALWLEQRSGNAHKPSGSLECANDPQPDLPMEFSSANLKNDLTDHRGDSNYTLALSTRQSDGSSETTSNWWKKFDPAQTKLSVEYNTNPNTPTAAQLTTHADYATAALACVTGAARPAVRSRFPWLKATVTDPDGGNGGTLSGVFSLQKWNGSAWAAVSGWPRTDAGVAPAARAEVQFTTEAVNGEQYRWQVQTKDTLGGSSGLSPWCEFTVDYAPPSNGPSVTPTDGLYLESPPYGTNQDMRGAKGYSGRFTFSANGVPDVYDYVYQVSGGPQQTVQATSLGGPATVWVTPYREGENVLTVWSRDQVGNTSDPYSYVFLVDVPSAEKAVWAMDEGSGSNLGNAVDGAPAATLQNGPAWTDTRLIGTHETRGRDRGVDFDGTDDLATTSGAVIDTSRSFSVSAWVRPDAIVGSHVVLSQPATNRSPFELQYYPTTQKWCFVTYAADAVNSASTANPACAGAAVRVGIWTHLTAVYDVAAPQQLALYVNGVRDGTGSTAPLWASTGAFTIGAARNGTTTARFNGAIDDVRVWDRVLDPTVDIEPITRPVLTGQWEMEDYDEEDPRQEGDGSGYQRPVTLTAAPGAQWSSDGHQFSYALGLDGVSGSADSSVPVVRSDQSFTVAAWVKPSRSGHQTIVAQDGNVWSAFYVMLDGPTGKWVATMPTADSNGVTWQPAYTTSLAPLHQWTHLVAVYDAQTRQLRLYVNGVLEATRANVVAWHGNSVFHIGRAKAGNHLGATVDRVRTWAGAMSDYDIAGLYGEI
ncbi:LamG domain-containing protein [Micromonospora echinospora]|uniref:LamG domain-containing protein n=1 Tax=Micromonospora echinospora TaxID=1877 RepID=UPI0033E75A8D